jgi:hypothetical protein
VNDRVRHQSLENKITAPPAATDNEEDTFPLTKQVHHMTFVDYHKTFSYKNCLLCVFKIIRVIAGRGSRGREDGVI